MHGPVGSHATRSEMRFLPRAVVRTAVELRQYVCCCPPDMSARAAGLPWRGSVSFTLLKVGGAGLFVEKERQETPSQRQRFMPSKHTVYVY